MYRRVELPCSWNQCNVMSQSQRRKKPFTKGRARKAVRLMPNVARVKRGKMRASQVSILVVLILQLIGRKKYFHCDWLKRVARVFKNFLNIWATLRGWLLVFWSGVGGGGTKNMFLGACIRVLVFLRVTGFFWADWACTFFFLGGGGAVVVCMNILLQVNLQDHSKSPTLSPKSQKVHP